MVGVRQSHNVATGNLATLCARNSKALRAVFSSKPSRRALKPPIASSIPTSSSPAIRATALTPDYVSHPLLVAEVLSESTAAFDRGRKFAAYRKLEVCRTTFWSTWRRSASRSFVATSENHWVLYDYGPAIRSNWRRWVCSLPVEETARRHREDCAAEPRQRPLSHERHPQANSVPSSMTKSPTAKPPPRWLKLRARREGQPAPRDFLGAIRSASPPDSRR
jgi:hypothetical protein